MEALTAQLVFALEIGGSSWIVVGVVVLLVVAVAISLFGRGRAQRIKGHPYDSNRERGSDTP